MTNSLAQQAVDEAIRSRRSIRAFLPTPVAREDIEAILEVAARAPSGTNTQPWKVYVLTGAHKDRLSEEILNVHNDAALLKQHQEEYSYYPREWVAPYIDRRRKVGWDLYALLGLTRENKTGMHEQHGRNYQFFGAPVGLIFTIDRVMQQGSWLDYGMFLQNVMIAARGRSIDTCPQAAFTQFHKVIAEVLELPPNEMIVCGMSMGYADPLKVENSLVTERAPLTDFVRFRE
ncbi:nitroreductase [Noviherbaspirillum saxi]|uniref:Nitroreductase n=1 Tax=Noviherbaspirillum saxi TaxID=2320863 RepID=A0A3A3FHL1_9BURK|nr:nitroreductase [Noviherbaspirillum saxi]RJF94993.1 nitroreductase [Noviherbaspirillum saxi]